MSQGILYSATHITRHLYQTTVSQCLNELRLTPRSLPGQRVCESTIRVQPEPVAVVRRKDYFGNDVTTASVFQPHERLIIEATSTVEVLPRELPVSSPSWKEVRDAVARAPKMGT